jgi:hypothetical protein
MIEFSVYQGLFFMLATTDFKVRLRGIQGNAIDGKEGLMALGMFEILDAENKPIPQSIAQLAFSPEHLELFGSKILKTGKLTITFE